MTPAIRILYAEDNLQDADLTRAHLAEHAPDFELQVVDTGAACLEQISRSPPDLLLLDHHLPDTDGVEMLKTLQRQAPDLPVVIVTGAGHEELVLRALRLGAATYVPKRRNYLDSPTSCAACWRSGSGSGARECPPSSRPGEFSTSSTCRWTST
jgi:CheY-like chemotaxis protein